MPKKSTKFHEIHSSPFYKLRSKAKLAKILFSSPKKLKALSSNSSDQYSSFKKAKSNGGHRLIDAPRGDLKRIQSRICNLLQRINPPNYLYSPVKGRSYIGNAVHHKGANSVRLLDVEEFFRNCSEKKVKWFFRERMKCSVDVAATLAGIACHDEYLPQGSPCSPIIAFFSYLDMWESINQVVSSSQCKISVYVDDITISGDLIPEKTIWDVKQILKKHGHRHNLEKERSKHRRSSEVTGVILLGENVMPPNRANHKLFQAKIRLKQEILPENQQNKLVESLAGRQNQINQIQSHNK